MREGTLSAICQPLSRRFDQARHWRFWQVLPLPLSDFSEFGFFELGHFSLQNLMLASGGDAIPVVVRCRLRARGRKNVSANREKGEIHFMFTRASDNCRQLGVIISDNCRQLATLFMFNRSLMNGAKHLARLLGGPFPVRRGLRTWRTRAD